MVENRQAECYAAVTITFVAATAVLVLRFVARRLKRISLWYDDWLIMVAYISAVTYDAVEYEWLHLGLGYHSADLPLTEDQVRYYSLLFQWIMEHAYTLSIAASQLSLLTLYHRAFDSITGVRCVIVGLVCCSTTWMIARIFITIFQCYPPQARWDITVQGHCPIDTGKFFFGTVAAHLFLDILLIILPASLISTLNLPRIQKFSISAMFMFGAVVCCCSVMMIIVGIRYKMDSDDLMWTQVDAANWSAVEINLSIITASLPLMRPIFRFVSAGFQSHNHSGTHESDQAHYRRQLHREQSYKLDDVPAAAAAGAAPQQQHHTHLHDDAHAHASSSRQNQQYHHQYQHHNQRHHHHRTSHHMPRLPRLLEHAFDSSTCELAGDDSDRAMDRSEDRDKSRDKSRDRSRNSDRDSSSDSDSGSFRFHSIDDQQRNQQEQQGGDVMFGQGAGPETSITGGDLRPSTELGADDGIRVRNDVDLKISTAV